MLSCIVGSCYFAHLQSYRTTNCCHGPATPVMLALNYPLSSLDDQSDALFERNYSRDTLVSLLGTMSTKYKKKELKVNDNIVATVLQGTQGCANLVAIHNLVAIRYSSTVGKPGPWTESFIKSVLRDMLQLSIDEVVDMPDADAKEAKKALANIRTQFSLQPCLSAHLDFVQNGSTLLCQLLKLPLLHGWVINPEDSSYNFLRDFSHSQLVDHYTEGKGDHVEACKRLLDDSSSQLTSYGFRSLSEELSDDGAALLFCRNRLDVIHKHNGALFIYVADQAICQQMPQAVWMLFEERQEKNIYFTDQYSPVKGQPHEDKAREWFREFLVNQRKGNEPKEDKGKEKNKSSQQRQSDDAAPESSEPSEATGKHGEDKSSDKMSSDDKRAEAVGSHHSDGGEVVVSHQDSKVKKSPQQAQSVDGAAESSESSATTGIFDGAAESSESSATNGILTTGNEAEVKSDKPTPEDNQRAEAVGSHHMNISVSQDGVPKGDASDFLNFLNE